MIHYQNIRFTLLYLVGISVLHAGVVAPEKPKVETKAKDKHKAKKNRKSKRTKDKVKEESDSTYKVRPKAVILGISVFALLYLTMEHGSIKQFWEPIPLHKKLKTSCKKRRQRKNLPISYKRKNITLRQVGLRYATTRSYIRRRKEY